MPPTVPTPTAAPLAGIEIEPALDAAYPRWTVKDASPAAPGVIRFKTIDAFGNPLGGVWVWVSRPDGTAAGQYTNKSGAADDTMLPRAANNSGLHSAYIRDSNYTTNLLVPTDTVHGMALPNGYALTFQRLDAPIIPPDTNVEQAALSTAILARVAQEKLMPVNNTGALWKWAKEHNLQDAQSDELPTTFDGKEYVLQVFNLGIVYAEKGDWGNIRVIPK